MSKRQPGKVKYDEALATEILARMAAGDTLQTICSEPGMPASATVRYWAVIDEPAGFAARYAGARELQAGALFDKALATSEEKGDAQLLRLRVDTLKWAAAKLHPRIYGDKIQTENASVDLTKLDDDQLGALERGVPLTEVLRLRQKA